MKLTNTNAKSSVCSINDRGSRIISKKNSPHSYSVLLKLLRGIYGRN